MSTLGELNQDTELAGKNNLSAIVAPVVGNDNTQGYQLGSLWVNSVTKKSYICVDTTTGAAVWTEITDKVTANGIVEIDADDFIFSGSGSTVVSITGNIREFQHMGNGVRTFFYQFIVPEDYSSGGHIHIWTEANDIAGNTFTMTAFINGTVDSAINAASIEPSLNNTWELQDIIFGDTLAPGDFIDIQFASNCGAGDHNAWRNFWMDYIKL